MGMMSEPLTNDLFPQALLPVALRGQTDLEGFRHAARGLLASQVLPAQVRWQVGPVPAQDRLADHDAPAVPVPPEFVTLCESVILHSDPLRFDLLYRLLWRLVHEPALRHDPLDADMAEAMRMAQAVRRDMQQMKASVRFHSVQDDSFRSHPEGGPLHVAWFAPEHHIVEAIAPFFARRFSRMRWALLTPEASASWDCLAPRQQASPGGEAGGNGAGTLRLGPGVTPQDAPAPDASQARWLRCYQQVFPAGRVLPKAMQRPLRRKRKPAELAHPLVSAAHQRHGRAAGQPVSHMARRPQGRAEQAMAAPPQGEQGQLSLDDPGQAGAYGSRHTLSV